jgi:cation diffusion facilitator family transporter
LVVVIAFAANLFIAVAKTIAAILTGSASMLAEAVHSWADAGNEIFLLVADRRAARAPDEEHPMGHGREAYFWALLAAFGVFTAGAVVSVIKGIEDLLAPRAGSGFKVAYAVLAVSFALEGVSLVQSIVQARRIAAKYRRGTLDYVLNGSNTTLRAVVAEDTAALMGLVIATLGVGLHQATGVSAYDAAGSLLIGVLLAGVAIVLIDRNRRYLVGASPPGRIRAEVGRALMCHAEVQRVTYLHLEFVGPSRLFLVAAVDLVGDAPEGQVAERLRRLEREVEKNELIRPAVLTLSVADEPSLDFSLGNTVRVHGAG